MPAKHSEQSLIRALNDLARRWPEGYMLFSWSGTLCLAKKELIPTETRQGINGHTYYENGSFDDAVIWRTLNIENDGGDPD